jgi:hypothetical protein
MFETVALLVAAGIGLVVGEVLRRRAAGGGKDA